MGSVEACRRADIVTCQRIAFYYHVYLFGIAGLAFVAVRPVASGHPSADTSRCDVGGRRNIVIPGDAIDDVVAVVRASFSELALSGNAACTCMTFHSGGGVTVAHIAADIHTCCNTSCGTSKFSIE